MIMLRVFVVVLSLYDCTESVCGGFESLGGGFVVVLCLFLEVMIASTEFFDFPTTNIS